MTSWDIFSPSATFGDEMTEDPEEARITAVYNTAKTAMQNQTKVTVRAYDERFKAYVQSIIDQEDSSVVMKYYCTVLFRVFGDSISN